MQDKINPHQIVTGHLRINNPKAPGGKFYLPKFLAQPRVFYSKSMFKNASQADAYAARVIARWRRLYDAWIVFQAEQATAHGDL